MKYQVALHKSEEGVAVSCPGLPIEEFKKFL